MVQFDKNQYMCYDKKLKKKDLVKFFEKLRFNLVRYALYARIVVLIGVILRTYIHFGDYFLMSYMYVGVIVVIMYLIYLFVLMYLLIYAVNVFLSDNTLSLEVVIDIIILVDK